MNNLSIYPLNNLQKRVIKQAKLITQGGVLQIFLIMLLSKYAKRWKKKRCWKKTIT